MQLRRSRDFIMLELDDGRYFAVDILRGREKFLGPMCIWYDGPHYVFALWWVRFSWFMCWFKFKDEHLERDPWIYADRTYYES